MNQPNYNYPPKPLPKPVEDTTPMFHGFWRMFGLMGTFLVGIVLFWWGANILIYDWAGVRASAGPIAYLLVAPLTMGAVLSWMSFSQILKIIKREGEV